MRISASNLPNWLRWALLLPGATISGFVAGYFLYLVNAAQAASPNAPIVFIGEFLGGLVSNLVAFHVAQWFAPSHERAVVAVLVSIAVVCGLIAMYMVVQEEDYHSVVHSAGNLVACYVAWKKYIVQLAHLAASVPLLQCDVWIYGVVLTVQNLRRTVSRRCSMVVGEYSTQSLAVASACRGNCARSSERARIETRARPHANSAASFNQPNTHSGRKQTMPTNSCHPEAPHRKLRLPDVFVSSLMLDRAVDAILRRVHLDHDHDVPKQAGYSQDGKTIYIDRHLPKTFSYRGKSVAVDRYLVLHEAVEKTLIDELHLHYQHAHQIATRAEEAAVRADRIAWREYDRFMQRYIKQVGDERLTRVPADLDLKPYLD